VHQNDVRSLSGWLTGLGASILQPIGGYRVGLKLLELGSVAHNKLLASLANSVGVPMDGWGDDRYKGTLTLT